MAYGQRQLMMVFFMIFMLMASSATVPISRSLKTIKNQVSVDHFHSQDVKEKDKDDWLLEMEKFVEGRMNMERADYPGTGANRQHDPRPSLRT